MSRIPLLPNPVLRRELLLSLRERRSFFMLLGLLLGMGAAMLILWARASERSRNSTDLAMAIFQFFSHLAFTLTPFVAVLLTAGAVTREREAKTLDMLVTANLRPMKILLGKLSACLGLTILLFALAAPLFAIVLLLGGVSAEEFVVLFGLILLIAFSYGWVGMAASAFCRSTLAATLAGLTYVGVVAWLPLLVSWAVEMGSGAPRFDSYAFSRSFLSASCPAVLVWEMQQGPQGGTPFASSSSLFLMAQAVAMMLLARVGYGAGRSRRPRPCAPVIDDPEVLRRRRDRFPYYLIDPRRRRPPIKDWQNPMTRKDSQTLLVGHKTRIIRIGYGAAALGVFLGAAYQPDRAWPFVAILFLCGAAAGAMAAVLAVHADRQGPQMDLLKTSCLSPDLFLRAKILVPFRFAVVMEFVLLVLALYVGSWMSDVLPWQTPELVLAIGLYALEGAALGALLGAWLGLQLARTAAALVAALLACAVLCWLVLNPRLLIFVRNNLDFVVPPLDPAYAKALMSLRLAPSPSIWAWHAAMVAAPLAVFLFLHALGTARELFRPAER